MEKLSDYQGITGKYHTFRDDVKEKFKNWKDEVNFTNIKSIFNNQKPPEPQIDNEFNDEEYPHIFRKKTRLELIRISAAIMGIEFSYAAETAFVSPTLLQIGVDHSRTTMVWALSPLIGFFLTPLLGSLSDKCNLNIGRRRPFILLLSIGILFGLILVPNGKTLGKYMGDIYLDYNQTIHNSNETNDSPISNHGWGVFFTILGTVLLDFDADACQSPSRAYLLDVTIPEDHARGLSTFAIMAGLGGFIGYSMGGFNWDVTFIGKLLGGHVKAAFTLITVIFLICVFSTITSFTEIPLNKLKQTMIVRKQSIKNAERKASYGAVLNSNVQMQQETNFSNEIETQKISVKILEENGSTSKIEPNDDSHAANLQVPEVQPSLKEYLLSIIYMPNSLRILCLTNLFCWMAHVCYSLNFTDYVGEAVFGGNPKAPEGSEDYLIYEEGVRFGCWGMSMYSLSCSCYSLIIEKLIKRFRAKPVYIGGVAFFGFGMFLMAILKNKFAVILFSWTAGVMYSTLFTMPFLIIAHYHSTNKFENSEVITENRRGLGTDVALVGSMVFLAQFLLSLFIGTLVSLTETTTVYVVASAVLSLCGSLCATQVLYLDL